MKRLMAVSIVQTALLALIGVRVLEIGAQTARLADDAAAKQIERAHSGRDAAPVRPSPASGLSAGQIRQIVREEIAVIAEKVPAPARAAADERSKDGADEGNAYTDSLYLEEAIRQDIESYAQRGRISEAEMAGLQQKIARLPPDRRRAALKQLVRAVNAGEIEARF